MRLSYALLLLTGLTLPVGCSHNEAVEIANNDSVALVQAIRSANERPGPDTIRLARNGLYVLSVEAEPGLLLPRIRDDLSFEGNHAEIRGYRPSPAALLQVEEGAAVRIEYLVLAEGTEGSIRNYGDLRLEHVAVVDSSISKMPAIVLNHGRLQAVDSEIAYNHLLAVRRDAGTVLNYGDIMFERTRIHDNRVLGSNPSVAVAGGILNFGSVQADGLFLANNELDDGPAPSLSFGGILNLGNGRFTGTTTSGGIRDGRQAALLSGR